MIKFADKLDKVVKKNNSLLCVGLDSNFDKLPVHFKQLKYPQFEFNKWIIQQTKDLVCAYKLNFAFYEARGEQGWHELKLTMEYINDNYSGVVMIADAKRGDVGNTNEGYVISIFDNLGFDAVTVNPYLGKEALKPFLERKDKGVIVLCKTSNKGSEEFQVELWRKVAENVVRDWNENDNCLLVAGATYPKELAEIRKIVGEMILLVPGIGVQEGEVEKIIKVGLNGVGAGMIINSSRGIIFSDNPGDQAEKLKDEINKYRFMIRQLK